MLTMTEPMVDSALVDLSDVTLCETSALSDEVFEATLQRIMCEVAVELAEEPSRFQSSI